MELEAGHEMHRSICMLHLSELPLRHIIKKLDGATSDAKKLTGPIGKHLDSCEKLKVTNFEAIYSDDMPVLKDTSGLSTDQKYLYDMVHSVQAGVVSNILANKKPGELNHARFLTLASRVLRYYVTVEKPSQLLRHLAEFVIKVYAPFWFSVKLNPEFSDGPRNFFKFIQCVSHMPEYIKSIAQKVLQNNAYFAHQENLLVAMLVDSEQNIRRIAVEAILKARQTEGNAMRIFELPKINWEASHYTEIVHFEDGIEPPLTKRMNEIELEDCIQSADNCVSQMVAGIPNHTQAVERLIRLVSDRSKIAGNETTRNQSIMTAIENRKQLPQRESKRDYIEFIKN